MAVVGEDLKEWAGANTRDHVILEVGLALWCDHDHGLAGLAVELVVVIQIHNPSEVETAAAAAAEC